MTGQVAASRHIDGYLVLQPAGHSASGMNGRPRRMTAVEADGSAVMALELDVGVLDVAWLVRRAAKGNRWAWERLVDQYARLIWAMTRDFQLAESDASDVAQMTWLRLIEHIDRLEHPARVGSWLAATARNECLRAVAARKKIVLVDDDAALDDVATHQPEVDERLLADERTQTVREALSSLPWQWQRLLELLMADPPASYSEISNRLGLPVAAASAPPAGGAWPDSACYYRHPDWGV